MKTEAKPDGHHGLRARPTFAELLDDEHRAIARIISSRPRCKVTLDDQVSCSRQRCPFGADCWANTRKTLNTLLFALVNHFDTEAALLKEHVYRQDYADHCADHVSILAKLTDILAAFTDGGQCLQTLDSLESLEAALYQHIVDRDVPMLHVTPPSMAGSLGD